jgi:hypothetical protein
VSGGISGVRLSRISLSQHAGALGTARRYDLRPPLPICAQGDWPRQRLDQGQRRDRCWSCRLPGGMPGLFASGVGDLLLEDVAIAAR